MIPSLFLDPLQMWRDAINRLEGEANTMATGSLKSPELVRSLPASKAKRGGSRAPVTAPAPEHGGESATPGQQQQQQQQQGVIG